MTDLSLNYEAQAAREERMLSKGVERYEGNAEFAQRQGDLSKAETSLFKAALPKMVTALGEAHAAELLVSRRAAHFKATDNLDHTLLAAVVLKNAFNFATTEETVANLFVTIGFEVRVAIATERLQNTDAKAHKKLMNARLTRSQRAKIEEAEALLAQFPEPGMDPEVSAAIGGGLLTIAQQATDLFEVAERADDETGQLVPYVTFTESANVALQAVKERQQWQTPVYQATLTLPNPWSAFDTGAYNDERVAKTVKMVNTFNPLTKKLISLAIEGNAPFVGALNAIQEVGLRLNRRVLEALEFCHDMRLKVGKLPGPRKAYDENATQEQRWANRKDNKKIDAKYAVVSRDLEEAKLLAAGECFFQPHVLDWRGRVYSKPGFNHQRADYCKGLFEIANGQVMNETGAKWLHWNVATTGGFKVNGRALDKSPFDVRVQWAKDNAETVKAIARAPLDALSLWSDADSPFCYLAACIALAAYWEDPTTYVCHLPIAIDGSCSGLQHFSAMARDADGGALVNLIPSELPQDVYAAVSTISKELVEADLTSDDENTRRMAKLWLDWGIDRSVTKRNVMTYGYGSVESGFASQLFDDIMDDSDESRAHFGITKDNWVESMEVARYLAKHNMAGIKRTVKGAPVIMELLQNIAGVLARANLPVRWTTAMGFPVLNAYHKPEIRCLDLILWNKSLNVQERYQPRITTGYSKDLNAFKQRSSISPNFIHSFDAAHLQLVVKNSKAEGINDFLLIHDSFASLPNDMDAFSMIVRKSMVEMYATTDPLQDLMDTARADLVVAADASTDEALTKKLAKLLKDFDKLELPLRGTLDLNSILESQYAFA